ncbi:MAG: hypothetical protein DRQ64_06680 [Gammaproteobacteria bacterium]|nr:MAG: hypothetical protein DRQ64_06680 [Gammaproteobacteria bacterium]
MIVPFDALIKAARSLAIKHTRSATSSRGGDAPGGVGEALGDDASLNGFPVVFPAFLHGGAVIVNENIDSPAAARRWAKCQSPV